MAQQRFSEKSSDDADSMDFRADRLTAKRVSGPKPENLYSWGFPRHWIVPRE
jgi:hypothetical protein